MRAAVREHLGSPSCTGRDTLHFGTIYLSSANPRYGLVSTTDNSCTYAFGYFVARPTPTSNQWHFVAVVGDSAEQCSYFTRRLPGAVVTEFALKGSTGSIFGTCVTAFTVPEMPTDLGPPSTRSPAVRPGRLYYTGDGSGFYGGAGKPGKRNYAGALHWNQWAHTQAIASGNDWLDNCLPNCAAGTFKPFRVTLTLTRPGLLDGYYVFTRLTVSYTAKLPPDQKTATQHVTVRYEPGVGGFSF